MSRIMGLRSIAWLAAAWALIACQDVEYGKFEPELPKTNDREYEFDIALLSEFLGSYEPDENNAIKANACIFEERDGNYVRWLNTTFISFENEKDLLGSDFIINIAKDAQKEVNVSCLYMDQNNIERYNVKNECKDEEVIYQCTISNNTFDAKDVEVGSNWKKIFTTLKKNPDKLTFDRQYVCISEGSSTDDKTKYNLRPNIELPKVKTNTTQQGDKIKGIEIFNTEIKVDEKAVLTSNFELLCKEVADRENFCTKGTRYECKANRGGAAGLDYIWNYQFKREGIPLIPLSNGDSFGATDLASKIFIHEPVLELLGALGLRVDTFGNRCFDNGLPVVKDAVSNSVYPYVVSNLKNVAQNFTYDEDDSGFSNHLVPSAIISIENKNNQSPLSLAVVGVLDQGTKDHVTAGNLGSMEIIDYCEVIYSMQEAYNQGARAFFILAHVTASGLTDVEEGKKDSTIEEVLRVVFSLSTLYFSLSTLFST